MGIGICYMMVVLLNARYLVLRKHSSVKVLILNLCRCLSEDPSLSHILLSLNFWTSHIPPREVPVSEKLLSHFNPSCVANLSSGHALFAHTWTLCPLGNTLSLFSCPHLNQGLHGSLSWTIPGEEAAGAVLTLPWPQTSLSHLCCKVWI